MKELQERINKMEFLSKEKNVIEFVNDGMNVTKYLGKVGCITYKGYKLASAVKAIRFAPTVANLTRADMQSIQGVKILGKLSSWQAQQLLKL